jgi:hypothetical protein
VEVGDHEVGVVEVHVDRQDREEDAGEAADREQVHRNDSAYSIGVLSDDRPCRGSVQLKTLIADGTPTAKVRKREHDAGQLD